MMSPCGLRGRGDFRGQVLVIHHAAGAKPEQFRENVPDILANKQATFVHCYADMAGGTIVNIYQAADAASVEREMETIRLQFDASADGLRAMM